MKRRQVSFLVFLMIFLFSACVFTMNSPAPSNTQGLLFRETAYNLTYWGLKEKDQVVIDRTEKMINQALEMLTIQSVTDMIGVISQYIETCPHFQEERIEYAPLIKSALRLLQGLLDVDFTIPEEHERVRSALEVFLRGALEGIQEIKTNRS